MARKQHMNWDGAPNFRWRKRYQGVNYRVKCDELGAMTWTEEGSRELANQWWERKLETLEGPNRVQKIVKQIETVPVSALQEMIEKGQAARLLLKEMPFEKDMDKDTVERILGFQVDDEDRRADFLGRVVEKVAAPAAKSKDRRFQTHVDKFLSVIQGSSKPLTFREIRDYLKAVTTVFGAESDVSEIDEGRVEAVFLTLKKATLSDGTKKKRWSFFKRFCAYLVEKKVIPPLGNLMSKSYKFKVDKKKVKVYDTKVVRAVLAGLTDRQRLYALLGLNCGMTSADIGQMTRDMIVGDKLTRRRVKTGHIDSVPTVTYRLWPEVLELLRTCGSDHPTLVLTGRTGEALWSSRQEADGRTPQKDMINQQWKRARIAIPHKAFRSISATLLESHKDWRNDIDYFLGHTPDFNGTHYAAPSEELFAEACSWLRSQIYPS